MLSDPRRPPLRLEAYDAEDLQALSALAQDAVLTVADLAYAPERRTFAAVMNRYCWERAGKGRAEAAGFRVRSGLHFGCVTRVRRRNFAAADPGVVLSLLAITLHDAADGGHGGGGSVIELSFSGGAAIRLDVECVEARLSDVSAPWPAMRRPQHER